MHKKIFFVLLTSSLLFGCTSNISSNNTTSVEDSQSSSSIKKSITITFDALGGNLSSSSIEYDIGKPYVLPTPSITQEMGNAIFDGWYLNNKKIDIQGDILPFDNDVTLTAKYKNNDFSFILNDDGYSLVSYDSHDSKVVLPSLYNGRKVTTIEKNVFEGSSITSIVIPSSYTTIKEGAFSSCKKLVSFAFSSAISFGENVFTGCKKLTKVYFDNSLSEYEKCSFAFDSNPSCNGAFLYIDGKEISELDLVKLTDFEFVGVKNLEKVNVSTITNVPSYCFYRCKGLKTFTSSSITNISENSFESSSVVEVDLNGNEVELSSSTFSLCYYLKSLTAKVSSLGNSTFQKCYDLESISFSDKLTEIPSSSFTYARKLKTLEFPSSLKKIGSNAFSYCTGIESISISENLTNIEEGAFSTTSSLIKIEVDSNNEKYESYENGLYLKGEDELLLGCQNTKIKEGTKKIHSQAFFGCYSLNEISLPSSLEEIDNYAFANTNIVSLDIPQNVTSIGNNAFTGCSSLTCINVDSSNTIYASEGNCLLNKDKTSLIYGCKNSLIPTSVTTIENEAFYYCSNLKNIDIPSYVTSIGNYAFSHCYVLESISIPSNVSYLGENCFEDDILLNEVTFYDDSKLTEISSNCFALCSSLKSIYLPKSVKKIASHSFFYDDNLASVSMYDVEEIEAGCFDGCESLSTMSLIDNNSYVYENNCLLDTEKKILYFGNSNSIFPSSLEVISDNAFAYQNIEEIVIPSNVKRIEDMAFYQCDKLRKLTLNEKLEYIGVSFMECSSLSEIYYQGKKEEFMNIKISDSAFYDIDTDNVICSDSICYLNKKYRCD